MALPSGATVVPTPPVTVKVPAATDWIAASKVFFIEAVFGASSAVALHNALIGTPIAGELMTIIIGTGTSLGVLWSIDKIANLINVKSYLGSPTAQNAGVVPQATGTPLVTTAPAVPPSEVVTP